MSDEEKIMTEEEFEEETARYVLTPKSCAYCALEKAEFIDTMFPETIQMKLFWSEFLRLMQLHGHVRFDKEEK